MGFEGQVGSMGKNRSQDPYLVKQREEVLDKVIPDDEKLSKGRVYVDDSSEAPEDAQVHEGQSGGLYYETDGDSGGGDANADVPDEDPEESMGDSGSEEGGSGGSIEDFDSTYEYVEETVAEGLAEAGYDPEDAQTIADQAAEHLEGTGSFQTGTTAQSEAVEGIKDELDDAAAVPESMGYDPDAIRDLADEVVSAIEES